MKVNLNSRVVYFLLNNFIRAWSVTLNYQRVGYKAVQKLRKNKQPIIFAIFHGEIFPLCYLHKEEGVTVVVSLSRDGELIAQILKRLGYNLARGSSSREGLKALLNAARKMRRDGTDVVFTVDGPRGPRHESKPGIVYLASRSRAHIVPARVEMSTRYIFSKSWDQLALPWLWSSCRVIYGEPYKLPAKLKSSEIHDRTRELDAKLKSLL